MLILWLECLKGRTEQTVDWGRKWLVDFSAGKLNWFCLTGLITLVLLMWKWNGSVLEEKSSFKMLRLTFCSKLERGSYIISIAKGASKKIGALIGSFQRDFLDTLIFYVLLFLVTPCLIVAVQPCMEWIPSKKKDSMPFIGQPYHKTIQHHHRQCPS